MFCWWNGCSQSSIGIRFGFAKNCFTDSPDSISSTYVHSSLSQWLLDYTKSFLFSVCVHGCYFVLPVGLVASRWCRLLWLSAYRYDSPTDRVYKVRFPLWIEISTKLQKQDEIFCATCCMTDFPFLLVASGCIPDSIIFLCMDMSVFWYIGNFFNDSFTFSYLLIRDYHWSTRVGIFNACDYMVSLISNCLFRDCFLGRADKRSVHTTTESFVDTSLYVNHSSYFL